MKRVPPDPYAGASSRHHQFEIGTPAACVICCAAVTERSQPSWCRLRMEASTLPSAKDKAFKLPGAASRFQALKPKISCSALRAAKKADLNKAARGTPLRQGWKLGHKLKNRLEFSQPRFEAPQAKIFEIWRS